MPSLKIRRLRTMANEVFRILNNDSPVYLQHLINIKDTKYSFRYQNITEIATDKTTRYGLKSFRYDCSKTME